MHNHFQLAQQCIQISTRINSSSVHMYIFICFTLRVILQGFVDPIMQHPEQRISYCEVISKMLHTVQEAFSLQITINYTTCDQWLINIYTLSMTTCSCENHLNFVHLDLLCNSHVALLFQNSNLRK